MQKNKQTKSIQRGQVALEYLVITGFVLLIVGILVGFAFFSFNQNAQIVKASKSVSEITNTADLVASFGEGSTIVFEVDIPSEVQSFSLTGKSATIAFTDNTQVFDYTKVNLTPTTLPIQSGRIKLSASFLQK
ncbi:MAG: hypothetical protein CL944_02135 [Candidatus Diapherotrites archaeon]|uniref:Class III signal peptide-containing protein n=1 Tax=Candidatus Iainarchaeum sp. TaxID=3101447 RepID=A0A2D6LPY6_9ARCH|nr:hypothetical protein [Candidatus Diapherotrites archaeon]|tara:strand:- start:7055 stop:7453 length:399 start_codon:yes stop_codon:yes gene_type:complete